MVQGPKACMVYKKEKKEKKRKKKGSYQYDKNPYIF